MPHRLRSALAQACAQPPRLGDGLAWAGVALALRLIVVGWAAGSFPPVEDGRFYHLLAARLADGAGYTWQWPDGVVTHVAHYPVGYPAVIALGYWIFGAAPAVAMVQNALLGSAAVLAAHRIAASHTGRAGAGLAAALVALHPALVAYTPALMTEGVTAALLALGGWLVVAARGASQRKRWTLLVGLGVLIGIATLVRGQSLLVAPWFGALAAFAAGRRPGSWRDALRGGLVVSVVAAAVVAPWTIRNCVKMDRCVAVSANLGWNLLIGATEQATGTFAPIAGETVPPACRAVFGEADKDACFAQAARQKIAAHPVRWLGLIPKKLAWTFEHCGAAGWYLGASNAGTFSDRARLGLATAETVWQRGIVLLGLWALARVRGPRLGLRRGLGLVGAIVLLSPVGALGYLALLLSALTLGRALLEHLPAAVAVGALAATALTHAVFFGGGRYSLVVFAVLGALGGSALGRRDPGGSSAF